MRTPTHLATGLKTALALCALALGACGQQRPLPEGGLSSQGADSSDAVLSGSNEVAPGNAGGADPSTGNVADPGPRDATETDAGGGTDPGAGSGTDPGAGSGTDPNAGSGTDPNAGGGTPPTEPTPAVLLTLGDIAGDPSMAESRDEATAALVDSLIAREPNAQIQSSGDNAQGSGETREYTQWFQAEWGRHKARFHPAPGNHDYNTASGAAYYAYFGAAAGTTGQGWYAYDLDAYWRVMVLNSNVAHGPSSAQYAWFRNELQTHASRNVIAVWHHPRFTSGEKYGPGLSAYDDLFDLAADHGVDIVLSSHDHHYECFEPMNRDGEVDLAHGSRQFVVGTGGYKVVYSADRLAPNSRVRITRTEGVTRFELYPDHYEWEFVPVTGKTSTDSGSSPVSSPPAQQ